MNKTIYALAAVVMLAVALPLQAQSGCINSPENPTAVLAIAGSAGAGFVALRTRLRARKK